MEVNVLTNAIANRECAWQYDTRVIRAKIVTHQRRILTAGARSIAGQARIILMPRAVASTPSLDRRGLKRHF